jgi:hypothetical protein
MKLVIQLPPLEIDIDEKDAHKAKQIAHDFTKWLVRNTLTRGWTKFANDSYPEFCNKVNLSFKEKVSDNTRMLKPQPGESMSDLLRHVAEVSEDKKK